MKNTSKSVRNVIVGKSNAKENISVEPNAILEIVRYAISSLEVTKIDSILDAMCDADPMEMDWLADVLRRAYPESVSKWYALDDATVDDLAELINNPPKSNVKPPKAEKKSEPAKKTGQKKPAKKTTSKKVATPAKDDSGEYE